MSPSTPTSESHRSGPVKSERTTDAIKAAVFAELTVSGFRGLSIDAVARRAGVGKAAIYRRWSSKREMVLSLLAEVGTGVEQFPDTGSLDGDLRTSFGVAARYLADPQVAAIVPDLLAEVVRDPAFGADVFARVGSARRDHGAELIGRAIDRGELPVGIDRRLAIDLLAAPLYWRFAVTREPFAAEDLERLVTVTVAALRAA